MSEPKKRNKKPSKLPVRVTAVEEESIYQTFLLTRNQSETSRIHKRSIGTVKKIIREMEKLNLDAEKSRQLAQAYVAESMQGRIIQKAGAVLDSIVPDDLADGVYTVPVYDPEDETKIIGKRMYGARGVEKATMFGILNDKLPINQKYIEMLRGEEQSGRMLVPADREELMAAINGKIESIDALRINFRQETPDLATRVESAQVAEAEVTSSVVVDLDEFDNPA